MAARYRSNMLLLVALLLASAMRPAVAAVDISGRWGVMVQSGFIGVQPTEWEFEQSGTSLVLTITFTDPGFSGAVGPYSGTIDPDTGVFSVDLPEPNSYPFPPCPESRIDGTATPDSLALSGSYTQYFIKTTPPDVGCNQAFGPFQGVRCGPGVTACCPGASCCGNGLVADVEECDDGNQADGDCCSAACALETAGSPCSDGNGCTDDLGCDGAGACQHADNSAPCGPTCFPGTCSGGLCDFAGPEPDTTPCDDGNACTADDHCSGTGNCSAGDPVVCGPCESCSQATGCVAVPQPALSCDADAPAVLALSVAHPLRSRVSWRRRDAAAAPGLVGDPTAATEYDLCVFDAAGLLFGTTVMPGGTCDGQPCWRATDDGYIYRDRDGGAGAVKRIDLREEVPAFRLKVKAQGPGVLPGSLAGAAAPLIAELRARDASGNACWQSRFGESAIKRGARTLRARN